MADTNQPLPSPQPEPTPAPAAPQAPAPAATAPATILAGPGAPQAGRPDRAPRPGPPRTDGPRRPFPKGDRPKNDGSKPPPLDIRDFSMTRPNTRDLDRSIEEELSAALSGFDLKGTMATTESQTKQPAVPGVQAKKKGLIIGIHGKDVFVEVPGGRSQGVLPLLQFEGRSPVIGEEVEFDIDHYDGANGLLILTMHGAAQVVTDWSSVTRGMVVEAKVTGVNKNGTGLHIEVNGIKGFMPASQIDMYRVEKLEDFVNQKMKCVVSEVDPSERNLVVSRKALLEREREQLREQFWATIEEGQIKTGIVRSVKPFGAFVDLGGADGLIPVSEMSWSRVGDPSEVVQIGQKVEVKVNRIDFEARKIGLSLRQLVRSPWDDFAERHKTGSKMAGKVTRIMDFGAFVEVAPGVEGLIHVSELATLRVRRVRDVVTEGQEITVQILSIDTEARRMSLSLKALQVEAEATNAEQEDAEREADAKAAEERMAQRAANPNLRGGIGAGRIQFDAGE
ncbi:30S ribosomal protein S1 [Fimbriiglobus ruber]|uniref:SSU ribosomal protein S1p n=1 Tax=Fimbriiglobus ruber TaxID=1908690 RepID=A0A225D1L6_9BACT|nr:S1 RNA-binding domain-containing protein [Fimbriiglobus ruber]OWK34813.1 SSU ribosomal protein S1p [Fimbriiglobus ruber]